MKNPTLVKRYVEGLAASLPTPAEYDAVRGQLTRFADLVVSREDLRFALVRPFLNASRKAVLVKALLDQMDAGAKTARFLDLLLRHGRMEILPRVLEDLPAAWRTAHGVPTFEVCSVVPLTPAQQSGLEAELERLEGRPVHCEYGLEASLVGGLTVRKGNLVYDVSLKGQLDRLKDKISER
ncbi:MAG: ATP synthase F1 subunit delta [Candidatus Aminicenantes bacterium]|nr:ATP synthase F1 subunit delta [Candidatus Aminicenantes bacterium]